MHINGFSYSKTEWTFAKLFTALFWIAMVLRVLMKYSAQPFPEGICSWLNCSFVAQTPFVYATIGFALFVSVLYVIERWMLTSLLVISCISLITFSLEISNGGHSSRMEILSMVFIVQFLGYLQHWYTPEAKRVNSFPWNTAMKYSVQIVATAYVISGVCKLQESGFDWFMQAENFSVRLLRSYSMRAIDNNNPELLLRGKQIATYILQHKYLIRVLFAVALFTELLAFIAAFSKRAALKYSFVLLLLHSGMFLFLGGFLPSFVILVFIYLLNLPGFFINRKQTEESYNDHTASLKLIPLSEVASYYLKLYMVPLSYLTLSFIIGETHPFSKFPMFSSSSKQTEFFYLADKNRQPVSGVTYFDMRCGEIKNMLYTEAGKRGIAVEDDRQMHVVADTVLKYILTKPAKGNAVVDNLLLMKRNIILHSEKLLQEDKVMAGKVPD